MPNAWDSEQELRLAMAVVMLVNGDLQKISWKQAEPILLQVFGGSPTPALCKRHWRTMREKFEAALKKGEDNKTKEPSGAGVSKRKANTKGAGRATKRRPDANDYEDEDWENDDINDGNVDMDDDKLAPERPRRAATEDKKVNYAEDEDEI